MMITKIFLSINILLLFSCSALQRERLRIDGINWNDQDDPVFHRYTDVEGVDHLWKINMDTLVFPRDNHLLDQRCYYHGGDSWRGGESIKLMIVDGEKQYIIRRVYPHIVEYKDAYAY